MRSWFKIRTSWGLLILAVRSRLGARIVAALLLGAGVFLSWSATGPWVTTAAGSHTAQGVDGHPPSGSQLRVFGADIEEGDKGPVNAVLLTVLLLASFFCVTAGWQLACDLRKPAPLCSRPAFVRGRP